MSTTTAPVVLRPPRHRVSSKAIRYWTIRALPLWLVVVAGQVIWWLAAGDGAFWHIVGYAITAVLAGAHLIVMPRWRFRVHRWEVTDEAVYTQTGWFDQEWRIAPLSRIQTVDTERGPFEALFGLANVTITTASAAGPIKVHGLDRPVALELADALTERTQATSGDAT